MFTFKKPFERLTEPDLELLLGEVEDQHMDFKEKLELDTGGQKREFAKDVTAMANASGGYLVFGVKEADGKAVGVPGFVTDEDEDELTRRAGQILRGNAEPQVPGLQFRLVERTTGTKVFIVYVPGRSWLAPHWYGIQHEGRKFVVRVNRDNVPMEYSRLQDEFLGGQRVAERLRDFRADRLSTIATDGGPTLLGRVPKVLLHIVPVVSLLGGFHLDLKPLAASIWDQKGGSSRTPGITTYIAPLLYDFDGFYVCKYNADGLWLYFRSHGDHRESPSFVQVFRNGALEIVDTTLLGDNGGRFNYRMLLDSLTRDVWTVGSRKFSRLDGYFLALDLLQVPSPWLLSVSFLGLKGLKGNREPLKRDSLLLPDVLVEGLDSLPSEAVGRLWDIVAQTAGDEAWKPSR